MLCNPKMICYCWFFFEMMRDDYDGQMIFGDLVGRKLPDIRLTGEEKPHPGNLSQRGSNPGPLRDKRTCYHLFHSSGLYIYIQSHPNTMRAYRWLSLAALACLLVGKRAVILMLLPNTHSVISVHFPSKWLRTSTYICKAETLAFTDCDYYSMLVL